MKVIINTHEHYWDCETCGFAGSTTISFNSEELGFFEDGEPATCFSGKDGDLITVLKELQTRLAQKGIIVDLKDYDDTLEIKYYEIMESVNWCDDNMNSEQQAVYDEYVKYSEEYGAFYNEDNLVKYFEQYGIELEFEHTCDEPWDDYDPDEHDEYYSELFDQGYTTDDSYERDDD